MLDISVRHNTIGEESSSCCHSSVEVFVSPVSSSKAKMMSTATSNLPFVASSLVDKHEPEIGHDYEEEDEDEKPSLVAVGSASDSDKSCDGNEEESIVKVVNTGASIQGETAESIGCLSDGFTSFLCPFDQQEDQQHLNSTALPGGLSHVQPVCLDASSASAAASNPFQIASSCAEFQLQDIIHAASTPGAEMIASLQSWLATDLSTSSPAQQKHKRCRNRSETPKSRDARVHQLWSQWHLESTIPLHRSKSCLKSPKSDDSDDLCYDSDPGMAHQLRRNREKPLTASSLKKRSRRSSKSSFRRPPPIDTSLPVGPLNQCPPTPRNAYHKPHPQTPRYDGRESQFFNSPRSVAELEQILPSMELESKLFFQEIVNSKVKLTWHPCATEEPERKSSKDRSPIGVSAWFELGAHLDQAVVQPKFLWNPTFESSLCKRKMQISCREPDSIELLSIVRVVSPTTLDRTKYPFARLDRACCISTNDDHVFVFEASSTHERDRLVNAMKMLVARLASIIIVRDERMLLEFFSPFAGLHSLFDDPLEMEDSEDVDYLDDDDEYEYSAPFLLSTTEEDRAHLWGTG